MAAKVTRASFPGHVILRPAAWRVPYIFASPHSGREYPTRFLSDSVLDLRDLRRSEDAYIDELMPNGQHLGAPMIIARFPRAFVDVNRDAREIDEYMFTASPVPGAKVRSNRVLAGFGAIPRLAAEGRAIYAKKLPASEGRLRMKWCYEPYHAALRQLVDGCREQFGTAILIDWHSMPSASAGSGRHLPDIVLGDRYGVSANASIVSAWEKAFADEGFSVTRNTPYAGGQVTTTFGTPAKGVHALQIEINRALYLDEDTVTRSSSRFVLFRERLTAVAERVIGPATIAQSIAAE